MVHLVRDTFARNAAGMWYMVRARKRLGACADTVCSRESDSICSSQVRLSVGYEAQCTHAGPGHASAERGRVRV